MLIGYISPIENIGFVESLSANYVTTQKGLQQVIFTEIFEASGEKRNIFVLASGD